MPDMFDARHFVAFLFDMDGTLLTSVASAERVWSAWGQRHGLDPERLLPQIHGVRAIDTVRRFGPSGLDPEAEVAAITRDEIADTAGTDAVAGVVKFLASLPTDRWAIVTSAPRALAEARLTAAGIAVPAIVVTAEEVENGKPAPDGYRLAARRLGVEAAQCLVFEDAAAGIEAAEAAGAAVLVVTATHGAAMATGHPAVRDYVALKAIVDQRGLRLRSDC